MQRRQHQMAGERGLHRDLRGLQIADLADHDDVRVLPQDGAQGPGEAQVDARIGLGLADAVEVVLDRILHRHDVERPGVEPGERRIQRGGFARARRPGHQHDAMRPVDQFVEPGERGFAHAEPSQFEPPRLLVEQAQHHALAVAGRQRRHPHVDRPPGQAQGDAAVLRQAFFGNVELRHHLDARHDRRVQRALRLDHVAQRAVHAKAHHRARLERLDVDVGRILAQRLRQERIDQADDRRVVLAFQQVGHLGDVLRQLPQIHPLLHVVDQIGRLVFAARIGLRQSLLERFRRQHLRLQRALQDAPHLGQRRRLGPLAQPDLDFIADAPSRHHPARPGKPVGQQRGKLRIRNGGSGGVHGVHRDAGDCGWPADAGSVGLVNSGNGFICMSGRMRCGCIRNSACFWRMKS